MNELIHADLFFFITSVAVVVLGVGGAIALYYIVGILRDVREIVSRVRKASGEIEEDFESLRAQIKAEGTRVRAAFDLLLGFFVRTIPRKRKKKVDIDIAEEELSD